MFTSLSVTALGVIALICFALAIVGCQINYMYKKFPTLYPYTVYAIFFIGWVVFVVEAIRINLF